MSTDDQNIFKTEAQELITRLSVEKGMTKAAIARAVGRDARLISYAASGEKPFANGVPALRQLLESPGPVEVSAPRRTGKQGGYANVRGGFSEDLKGGRYTQTKGNMGILLKEIQAAAEKGQKVNVSIRYDELRKMEGKDVRKHAEVNIYGRRYVEGRGQPSDKRGHYAGKLMERVEKLVGEKAISPEQALQDILENDADDAAAEHYEEETGEAEQFSVTAYDV